MRQLIYQELIIVSDLERSAEVFQFGPKKNLILGKRNKVGKTSLCTSLMWSLGGQVSFPPKWKELQIKTLVKFVVAGENYSILRTKDNISIHKESTNDYFTYEKITGGYAKKLAEIINFEAYLKHKNSKYYSPAFPSAQLLPSFIHSDKGWGDIYNSFTDLRAYSSSEKKYVIEYLIGIRGNEFFGPRKERSQLEQSIEKYEIRVANITEVQTSITDFLNINYDNNDVNDLDFLLEERSFLKHNINIAKSEKYELRKQIGLIKKAESDLFEDYIFATNDIDCGGIICPTCGVQHENDIVNRFSILDEREVLIESRKAMELELHEIDIQIKESQHKIDKLTAKIALEEKISDLPPSFERLIAGSSNYVKKMFNPVIDQLIDSEKKSITQAKVYLESIPKFRTNKEYRAKVKNITDRFAITLIENLHKMNVFDADESKILEDPYQSIHVSGSDISRMTLAYYKTLNEFIKSQQDRTLLPMVIDSPIQQEQDELNITTIMSFIKDWDEQQVLIFGKEYDAYTLLKKQPDCKLISLDVNRRILSEKKYTTLNDEIVKFNK
ncbi:hypothetical protein C0W88_08920 [Photobacterium leiognathi subsp. mandapamensis]|uniref:hypothetical protein n=2 Tax=Photobacterium leiognathi TaxID=553611 RepID=UPI000D1521AC|nr:hypothetical protein [Photobacterium leiognathi]PSW66482.1 hypothetical protein C0W88_08920 [Photobacterium leiognathi subsp. mandapamensis]